MGPNRAFNTFLPTVNVQDEIKGSQDQGKHRYYGLFIHSSSLLLSKEHNINHMATVMGSGTAVCQMSQ